MLSCIEKSGPDNFPSFKLGLIFLNSGSFSVTLKAESAFVSLKEEIVSDPVLFPFDPKLPVVLSCHASPTGVAGILSHIVDMVERPVAFASRALTEAEQNFSQLDREAVAIVFSVG